MSKTAGHTPGPWFVNPTGDIGLWHIGTADCPIASVETELPDKIWKANARLIAAAPELLAMCKLIMAEWDSYARSTQCFDSRIITGTRLAIQKAEGRA